MTGRECCHWQSSVLTVVTALGHALPSVWCGYFFPHSINGVLLSTLWKGMSQVTTVNYVSWERGLSLPSILRGLAATVPSDDRMLSRFQGTLFMQPGGVPIIRADDAQAFAGQHDCCELILDFSHLNDVLSCTLFSGNIGYSCNLRRSCMFTLV